MRILIPHFTQVGEVGGVQTVVETLARKLAANGHEATILEHACDDPRSMPGEQRVKIRSIQYPGMPFKFRRLPSLFRSIKRFRQVCDECLPEVVNLHFPLQQTPAIVWAASMPHRWKLVVTFHLSELHVFSRQIPQLMRYHRRLLKLADVITCVDTTLLKEAAELHPSAAHKMRLIPNGVELIEWEVERPAEIKVPYVLFAARMHPVKGIDILLKAWKNVSAAHPEIQLVMAGDGAERALYEQMAQELGIKDHVQFIGWADKERLAGLLQHCITMVMPSRNETHSCMLKEAMASGAACIATPVGALPEIIGLDDPIGWLVPVDDVAALSEKLLDVINLPEDERKALGKKAKERIRSHYPWDNIYPQYLAAYQDALDTKKTNRR
jgi:glycosyltransferase involved in cell wall biosynthesis